MTRGGTHRIGAAATIVMATFVAARAASGPALPSGEPLAVESTALVPLDTESSISIAGIHGVISIATRDERELRVVSRLLGPQGGDSPVGIWQGESSLTVAPAPREKDVARLLSVEVPRGFAIDVDAADSDVVIQSADGSIALRGSSLRASVVSNKGYLVADLDGGTLTLRDSNDATLRLRGTTVTVDGMSRNVNVRATNGTISLANVSGSTDIESEDCTLVLDDLLGSIHVKARRGEATVARSLGAAEFEMAGTPLLLKDGKGDVAVTSDATVAFDSMAASMRFDMYGGALRGKGNRGAVEVRTRNSEVNLEAIELGVRIRGDGLKANIVDVGGELSLETSNSDFVVDRVGNVVAKVDRGNVTIQNAARGVQATVVDGQVHLIDGNGPVILDLDGGDAEVSWATISGDKDSRLTNKSGSVTVRFPRSGHCRVEAKSRHGRIDSDLPTVRVMEDLSEAQGPINGGIRPIVTIAADGDIHLLSAPKDPESLEVPADN